LIVGEITALEPEFAADRLPVLNVQGYDFRLRLQKGQKTRTFRGMKDSAVAAQIGSEAGLNVQATETKGELDLTQTNQTDWEFLNERASLIGYEVAVEGRTLFFRPVGNDKDEILTLDIKGDLMEFHPRLSSAGQVTEVWVQSWSMKEKKAVLGKSEDGREGSRMGGQMSGAEIGERAFGPVIEVIIDQPVEGQAEAQQIAQARFNSLSLDLIAGEGTCSGNTKIRAGKVIKIDGIGERFSGRYYVTSAIHRNSITNGYVTEFKVRRDAS
jgi:uncharacterized protein